VDDKSLWTAASIFGTAIGAWLSARAYSRRSERSDWLGYQERSLKAAVDRANEAEMRVREEERRHEATRVQLRIAEVKTTHYVAMVITLREAINRLEDRLNMPHTQFPDIPFGGD